MWGVERPPFFINRSVQYNLTNMDQDNAYDVVLAHLISEGYADNIKSAENIMECMSEEWVGDILEAKYGTKKGRHKLAMRIKKGEDVGKKAPGSEFEKVARKAAEKYGSAERGKKVAAAAMWKHLGK